MRWMPRFGSRGSLAVLGAVVVLVILLVWMVLAYNALVAKETAIEAQWAEVENRYQLKVDKIPQLVAAAEGYQEFERSTLENITRLPATATEVLAMVQGQGKADLAGGYELDIIASAVVGGASLFGGRGSVSKTVVGALIIQVLQNGLVMLNVPSPIQQIIIGMIIILAVGLDMFMRRNP